MNGGADLGGMQGFGPVVEEADEPNFHSPWESRAMAIIVALGACRKWNIDQSRYARESLPPADYLSFPYYRIWIEGAEKLLVEHGMIAPSELQSGISEGASAQIGSVLNADRVWEALHSLSGAADRPDQGSPVYKIGQGVRTINSHPPGHTRLPRYARGRDGTISKVLGHHVYPDSSGNGRGEDPQWLYQVRFSAQELWGADRNPRDSVTLDLWEPHLVEI